MNAFDLMWHVIFIGGGIAGGGCLTSHWIGPVAGGVMGYVGLATWSWLNTQDMKKCPRCQCGIDDWGGFTHDEDETWGFVTVCQCGRRYLMRKGCLFFEVGERDIAILVQIKPFYGDWREPTEKDIAATRVPSPR